MGMPSKQTCVDIRPLPYMEELHITDDQREPDLPYSLIVLVRHDLWAMVLRDTPKSGEQAHDHGDDSCPAGQANNQPRSDRADTGFVAPSLTRCAHRQAGERNIPTCRYARVALPAPAGC